MKLSQAKKITAVLLEQGNERLAKTFAASITGDTAQKELKGIIDEHSTDRNVKEKKGPVNKSEKELVKKQKASHPFRNIKESNKIDKVGNEFKARKREPAVTEGEE